MLQNSPCARQIITRRCRATWAVGRSASLRATAAVMSSAQKSARAAAW